MGYPRVIWALVLVLTTPASALAATPPPVPLPRDKRIARIIEATRLSYAEGLSADQRLADLRRKTRRALELMDQTVGGIRRAAQARIAGRAKRPSWSRCTGSGDRRCAVRLEVPVWVPAGARRLPAFAGTEAEWSAASRGYRNLPHPSGSVWVSRRLARINDKQRYRARTLSFPTFALHAPLAFLLLEHAFREGRFDPRRRIPIMAVRSGEDCYAADRSVGVIEVEGASFAGRTGHRHKVRLGRYSSPGEFLQGCHVRRSNHRIGCALDVNYFWLYRGRDGAANAITASRRHRDRERMHAVDARNLPQWLYDAARSMGYRVPEDWTYPGGRTDWPHLDLGR